MAMDFSFPLQITELYAMKQLPYLFDYFSVGYSKAHFGLCLSYTLQLILPNPHFYSCCYYCFFSLYLQCQSKMMSTMNCYYQTILNSISSVVVANVTSIAIIVMINSNPETIASNLYFVYPFDALTTSSDSQNGLTVHQLHCFQ